MSPNIYKAQTQTKAEVELGQSIFGYVADVFFSFVIATSQNRRNHPIHIAFVGELDKSSNGFGADVGVFVLETSGNQVPHLVRVGFLG